MKRILSGITPSGKGELHIGNYFGAVKNFVELQKDNDTIYFIADLHALTTIQDKNLLEANILNVAIDYLSLGIDPKKSILFRQSDVYAHPYLESLFTNFTPLGLLKRAHAYKDKLQKDIFEDDINMGLFTYPVLMASDILLYKPDLVPVGKDQKQHVEITRDIAENFNKKTGTKVFKLPDVYMSQSTSVVLGTDGQRKMSKSLGNTIGIFESAEEVKRQIMKAVTDPSRIHPTDPGKVEGNVIFTFHDLLNENKEEVDDLKQRYLEGRVGDVEVKQKLFDAHQRFFGYAIEKKKYYESHINEVKEILEDGGKRASEIALKTLDEAKDALGLKIY